MIHEFRDFSTLLVRWHEGEDEALHALIEDHLPWVRGQVRRHLTPLLRAEAWRTARPPRLPHFSPTFMKRSAKRRGQPSTAQRLKAIRTGETRERVQWLRSDSHRQIPILTL